MAAAESIPDGLLILDAEDRIVFYRQTARKPELLPSVCGTACAWHPLRRLDPRRHGTRPDYHRRSAQIWRAPPGCPRRGAQRAPEHRHVDVRWVRDPRSGHVRWGAVLLDAPTSRRGARRRSARSPARRGSWLRRKHPRRHRHLRCRGHRVLFYNSRLPENLTADLRRGCGPASASTTGSARPWPWADLPSGYGPDFAARRMAMRGTSVPTQTRSSTTAVLRNCEKPYGRWASACCSPRVTERRRRERQPLLAMAIEQVGDAVETTESYARLTS